MNKNIKTKISDNTLKKDSEVSDYSIAYSARKMDNLIASYEIISALKEEDNLFIEINSSLLSLTEYSSKAFTSKFLADLENMKIEYRNKKILVNAKRSLFSFGQEGKKIEGFNIFAYIPNEIWKKQEFRDIIPNIGVRYYLLKKCSEINIDTFVNLDEVEKLEQCKMVIFDHILFGSMGINTSIYIKEDIIELLNK